MTLLFLVLINATATILMTGVIWFVQIVHYPLFAFVGATNFTVYEEIHKRLTTVVVGPLMVLELMSSLLIPILSVEITMVFSSYLGLAMVVVIWLVTAFVQIPLHNQLSAGYSLPSVNILVKSNWIRTALWSGRSILVLFLIFLAFDQI